MYDVLTMRIISALLVLGTVLAAGWEGLKASRKRGERVAPSPRPPRTDPARLLTRIRDVFLILSLALVLSIAIIPSLLLNSILEFTLFQDSAVQTLGIFLIAAGSVLGLWAVRTLGEFSMERIAFVKNHRLITTGPYRIVRHPMYGSTFLVGLGLVLLYLNIVFLILALLVFSINVYRARVEERLLSSPEAFGDQYKKYCKRTRRFIPFIL